LLEWRSRGVLVAVRCKTPVLQTAKELIWEDPWAPLQLPGLLEAPTWSGGSPVTAAAAALTHNAISFDPPVGPSGKKTIKTSVVSVSGLHS
jgi:hypothetical protein